MHPRFQQADRVATDVVDAAAEVLRHVGMGLLESVYEHCLARELRLRGHTIERERQVTVDYKGERFATVLRADLLVDGCVVVELKSIEGKLRYEHKMQILSYMHLLDTPVGLIINFGATDDQRIHRVLLRNANRD